MDLIRQKSYSSQPIGADLARPVERNKSEKDMKEFRTANPGFQSENIIEQREPTTCCERVKKAVDRMLTSLNELAKKAEDGVLDALGKDIVEILHHEASRGIAKAALVFTGMLTSHALEPKIEPVVGPIASTMIMLALDIVSASTLAERPLSTVLRDMFRECTTPNH